MSGRAGEDSSLITHHSSLGTVGPFQIERLLARGGMGEAFLATDPRSGKRALLKLPLPEMLGDIAARARFEREGAALSRLRHPGVQRFIETGSDGLRPYVALEYIEGQSLRDVLDKQGRLGPMRATQIAASLADALAYCHANGIVHRDVKPENVILRADGSPALIDFGSVLLQGARRLTYSGLSAELGTPEYMAPEQVQGKRGDARTDVYALGTLLYELLTGRPPFKAGAGESAVQVMRRHLEESPPAPEPAISPALAGVLARALRRDPDQRFQTMADFAAALRNPEAAIAAGQVQAGWPSAAQRAGGSWASSLDEPQSLRDWLRYCLVAAGALLVLVLIGVLATILRPGY